MDDKMNDVHHLIDAARYSLQGLARAWEEETAFRHEVVVLALLCLLLLITETSPGLMLLAIGGWLFVMALELLNSAVENAFNIVSEEQNDRIKAGKYMASAAIFLGIVANAGIWLYVFFC
jgi:diacylglycerol kinase (ATP)